MFSTDESVEKKNIKNMFIFWKSRTKRNRTLLEVLVSCSSFEEKKIMEVSVL